MNERILSGRIYLTSNIDFIVQVPQVNEFGKPVRILDLDEDDVLQHRQDPNVISATCLLPPVEAKIAEADGNEQKYDYIYHEHLTNAFCSEFASTIIAFLYAGGDLIFYLPNEDYNNTRIKFLQHFNECYGIMIGIIGENQNIEPMYNAMYTPFWLSLMFMNDIIGWKDYLILMPLDAKVDENMMVVGKLISIIQPYMKDGNWYENIFNDQVNYLVDLHKKLHNNINVVPAIRSV